MLLTQMGRKPFRIGSKCRWLFMERETRRAIRELAYYSSLGLQIALSIFLGLFLGIYLDRRLGSMPWLTLMGLGMGILAGYRNIGLAIKKSRKL